MEPKTLNEYETAFVLRYQEEAQQIVNEMVTIVSKLVQWPEDVPLKHMSIATPVDEGRPIIVFDTRTHALKDGVVVAL